MSRQREAWQAWPAGASSYGPSPATGIRHASDPGGVQTLPDLWAHDAHGTRDPYGYGPFGHGAADVPTAHALAPHLPRPTTGQDRPAAVRSPVRQPRRTRRPGARRAGTRRKARPRDPLLPARLVWALVRVALGLVFLWTFADRLLGLNRPVAASHAWLHGGSPTRGYLATAGGPFAPHFHAMAGQAYADWLFMLGTAGIGTALVLGVGMRLTAVFGTALLTLIYLAGLPVEAHPLIDQHIVYALVLIALALSRAGDTLGLGGRWSRTRLVQAVPVLR